MAEPDSTSTSPSDSTDSKGKGKKKGGLITFIKKNKTLSAVVGAGGLYFLYKMNTEKSGSGSGEPEGEVAEISNEGGAIAGTAQAAAFELGRSERLAEGSRQEVEEVEEEREEERRRTKEKERELNESEGVSAPEDRTSPTSPGGETEPVSAGGKTIHGKEFTGATSSHIAKSGKTSGGKAYVEYAIQFPGRIEHWQYFPATGNWRRVSDSSSGGGANKPGPGTSPSPNRRPDGGHATGQRKKRKPAPVGVGPAKPVSGPAPAPPANNAQHPAAVNTGNKCVNGGVGGHTAPAGYHLFCQGGWIWRAPNS
jgi:hypothetical protein